MSIRIKFKTDYADINNDIYEFKDSITFGEMVQEFLFESNLKEREKNKTIWLKDGKTGLMRENKVREFDFVYNGKIIGHSYRDHFSYDQKL